MRNITYKYNVGDVVKFKDHYDSSASCDLFELAGTAAKVIDRADFGGPTYKLEGYEDTWFKQGCFAGLATVSVDTPDGTLKCEIVTNLGTETKCDTESSGESKKKTKTNIALLTEALTELSDVLDYIASEKGTDDSLYVVLSGVETKLETVISRYARKVVQQ